MCLESHLNPEFEALFFVNRRFVVETILKFDIKLKVLQLCTHRGSIVASGYKC